MKYQGFAQNAYGEPLDGTHFQEIDISDSLPVVLDPRSETIRFSAERAVKSIKRIEPQRSEGTKENVIWKQQ